MTDAIASKTPPTTVLAAIFLLLLSLVIGAARVLYAMGLPRYLSSYLILAAITGVVLALCYGLYRRNRFCRWFVVVVWLVGATLGMLALSAVPPSDRLVYALQGVVQLATGVLLLLPASSRWYKS